MMMMDCLYQNKENVNQTEVQKDVIDDDKHGVLTNIIQKCIHGLHFAFHTVGITIQTVVYSLYKAAILIQCNDIEMKPGPNTKPIISKFIRGTFHQGDSRFSEYSVANQCAQIVHQL